MSQTKAQLLDGKSATIQFTGGSASTPSVSFTGDTNTGIYSPGADQLAISTNGTGRLFIGATGGVGVGANAFTNSFEVVGSAGIVGTSGIAPALRIQAGSGVTDGFSRGSIQFYDQAGTGGYVLEGAQDAGRMRLSTRSGGVNSERLCITSAGLVGVGTSAPSYLLSAVTSDTSATTYVGQLFSQANPSGTSVSYLRLEKGGGFGGAIGGYLEQGVGSGLKLSTLNGGTLSEAVTITNTGRVGIGTTSPGYILDTFQSINTDAAVNITNSNAGTGAIAQFRASNGTNSTWFGIGGTGYNGYAQIRANGAAIYTSSAAGIGLSADNASGFISFGTGSGATERARIDSSGRLLVGTSSARSAGGNFGSLTGKHIIVETTDIAVFTGISNKTSGATALVTLGGANGSSVGSVGIVGAGAELGRLQFVGADGVDLESVAASIGAFVDGTPGTNDMPGRLVFSTTADGASSPTERMRINSEGRIFVNSTSTVFTPTCTQGAGTSFSLIVGKHSATNGSQDTGTTSFIVYTNGNVVNTNNSYGAISDAKLKENIVDATSQWSDIKALQVRKYNFKEGQTHTQIGLVAQEVELVSPGLVTESPDHDAEGNDLGTTTKSVNYSVLYMKAVKALQEAMERIEQLETEMAAVKAQLA